MVIAAGERLRESPRVDRLLTAGGEEDVGARHHVRREAGAWLAVKVVEARLIPTWGCRETARVVRERERAHGGGVGLEGRLDLQRFVSCAQRVAASTC